MQTMPEMPVEILMEIFQYVENLSNLIISKEILKIVNKIAAERVKKFFPLHKSFIQNNNGIAILVKAKRQDYKNLKGDEIALLDFCKKGDGDAIISILQLPSPNEEISQFSQEQKTLVMNAIAKPIDTTDNNKWSALYWLVHFKHDQILDGLFNWDIKLIDESKHENPVLEKLSSAIIYHQNSAAINFAQQLKKVILEKEQIDFIKVQIVQTAVRSHNLEILKKLWDPENGVEIFDIPNHINRMMMYAYRPLLELTMDQGHMEMLHYLLASRVKGITDGDIHTNEVLSLLYKAIFEYVQFPIPAKKDAVKLLLLRGVKIILIPNTPKESYFKSRLKTECVLTEHATNSLNNFIFFHDLKINDENLTEIRGWLKCMILIRNAEIEMGATKNNFPIRNFERAFKASPDFFTDYITLISKKSLPQHDGYTDTILLKLQGMSQAKAVENADLQSQRDKKVTKREFGLAEKASNNQSSYENVEEDVRCRCVLQ